MSEHCGSFQEEVRLFSAMVVFCPPYSSRSGDGLVTNRVESRRMMGSAGSVSGYLTLPYLP